MAVLAVVPCRADTTVTVTKRAPLEAISATGEITGVSEAQIGAQFTLVGMKNGLVVFKDAQGSQFEIAPTATDYTPPASTATATPAVASTPTATNNVPAATNNAVATATAGSTNAPPTAESSSAHASSSVRSSSPATPVASTLKSGAPSYADVNAALGKPFFSDQPIWNETALLLAQRVGLGLEGRTQWEASYRRYLTGQPNDPKSLILDNAAYCIAIYADAADHPSSMLIAFANDGDFRGIGRMATDLETRYAQIWGTERSGDTADLERQYRDKFTEMISTFEPIRRSEEESLVAKLTGLFGDPQRTVFGSDPTTREDTLRWDWNGASFLLTCQPHKYNLLRIVSTDVADNNGRMPRVSRDDIGHRLSGAVEHRPNSDVIITQIPMADQGRKGYCVPATWERVLRYTGVPGDMYTLSRIGNAEFGGGEWGIKIAEQLNKTLYDYGRRVDVLHPTHLDYISLRHYIDDGIPVFWDVNINGYEAAEQRYSLCERDKDFNTWKKLLDQARSHTDTTALKPYQGGHQVLIIGYNPDTKEIAWTDPWGRETKERWMTQEEALRCTLNEYYVITW